MLRQWRSFLKSAASNIPSVAAISDTAEHRRVAYLRAMQDAPANEFALGSEEGARAHVLKAWGPTRANGYILPVLVAMEEANDLLRWRRQKRAKGLTRHESRLVQVLQTRYGVERVFHAALREFAKLDPAFAAVLTPRSAYLAAAACGLVPPPSDEVELRKAEDRWRKRRPEKFRALDPDSSD